MKTGPEAIPVRRRTGVCRHLPVSHPILRHLERGP
jgi:hypothetical protein